jgi:FixJ family two-component response regulator
VLLQKIPVVSIVDDDPGVRSAMVALLRSLGYRALGFSSAEEFLSAPEIEEINCLILDVHMPGMSGIDLQRTLARQNRKLPIIFITAFSDDRLRRQAMDGGACCFLTKPFDPGQVATCLASALARRA